MKSRILVVIPAYRCERQIRRVLADLASLRDRLRSVAKVLVLDNRSPDGTAAAARDQADKEGASDWVEVWINPENRGLGGSQKIAFQAASEGGFSHVVILHGDDQADVSDLPAILSALDGYDAVLGSRFMRGSRREGYSWLRTAGNVGLNWVYSFLCGRRIRDLGSGLNGFRTEALRDLPVDGFSDRFTFNMDLLLALIEKRKSIVFLPIRWRERDQVSNAGTFDVGWTALLTVLRWRLGGKRGRVDGP